jgi:hypothetical protein
LKGENVLADVGIHRFLEVEGRKDRDLGGGGRRKTKQQDKSENEPQSGGEPVEYH